MGAAMLLLLTRRERIVRLLRTRPKPLLLEPEIPPPAINYNQSAAVDAAEYVRQFKTDACLRELPFLMRMGLGPSSAMLDYGCGLGRLAYAASKYLSPEGSYFGYEPNPVALAFLKGAYAGRANFSFAGRTLRRDEDYVAIERREARDGGDAAGEIDLSFVRRPLTVQWSCSVFTHMWVDPIVNVLKSIGPALAPGAVCVNTWLCIDEFAAYALRCGVADRALPHQVNRAYTYSQTNPLVCTAYDLSTVREIYARADHDIVDILWGSWSGRDNGVTYQDIVVSKRIG
jgi:SAM-dependent methyltransferase